MNTEKMDIVYICQAAERNEALRYSLRSLANLPHRKVWIVGYRPKWVRGCEYVATQQRGQKHTNTWRNWIAAANTKEISGKFILFNDDFFVTRQVNHLPIYHRGKLDEMINWYGKRRLQPYRTRAVQTRTLLQQAGIEDTLLSYELHVPLIIDRAKLAEAIRWLEGHRRAPIEYVSKRTFYGNFAQVGGTKALDVKVQRNNVGVPKSPLPFLSTSPLSWSGLAGGWVRALFPQACDHEKQSGQSSLYRPPSKQRRAHVRR